MNSRQCYLHVGTGKTGSSAIQYAWTKAQADLLEEGIRYPDAANNFHKVLAGKPTAGNGLRLNQLLHAGEPEAALNIVRNYISLPEDLLFSCEGFANVHQDTMKTFVEGLSAFGYMPRCLVYFRTQVDRIVSSYLQQVKSDKPKARVSLDQYIEEIGPRKLDRVYNWHARAKKLEAIFGKDNLTVRWYPALRRAGLNAIPGSAFEWLGKAHLFQAQSADGVNGIINPTPGREALIVLQEINASGCGGREFADDFLERALTAGLTGRKVTISKEAAEQIHSLTYESNKRLLEEYCPELSITEELTFSPPSHDNSEFDEHTLAELRGLAKTVLSTPRRLKLKIRERRFSKDRSRRADGRRRAQHTERGHPASESKP